MNTIENLNWRAAIKKFDSTKKVSEQDIEKLIEAANLAPTSAGLQPFKLIVVSNEQLKSKLREAAFDQAQLEDASHVFVFAAQEDVGDRHVNDYMDRMVEVRKVTLDALAGYKQMITGFINTKDSATKADWAARQAYIALGTMISAAAEMQIDACPMEGFNPDQVQEILDLKSQQLIPVLLLPVGFRSHDDIYAKAPKVRKTRENLVIDMK